jgi:hypothetical protein
MHSTFKNPPPPATTLQTWNILKVVLWLSHSQRWEAALNHINTAQAEYSHNVLLNLLKWNIVHLSVVSDSWDAEVGEEK